MTRLVSSGTKIEQLDGPRLPTPRELEAAGQLRPLP